MEHKVGVCYIVKLYDLETGESLPLLPEEDVARLWLEQIQQQKEEELHEEKHQSVL